jgi:hypothetical protein
MEGRSRHINKLGPSGGKISMGSKSGKELFEVVWPRSRKIVESVPYARRFDTLNNIVIGELSDRIFRADEIFPVIEDELKKRFPGIKFVNYEVFGSIHGTEEVKSLAGLKDSLRQNRCDAVISAVGC